MLKHILAVAAITGAAALLAIPATNYAFMYGSWMAAYYIHFGLFEIGALIIYAITIGEMASPS